MVSLQIVECFGVQKHNCKLDFPVEILVLEDNLKQVLDGKKQGMGCVCFHIKTLGWKCVESPQCDTQAMMVDRIHLP